MDDLLSEFLTETAESLDVIDAELVKFEREPNNAGILDNIFRLMHTIKGTCGFLGLPRLEALAHAAETLMGTYRDGAPVTGEGVSLILRTIDRIKELMNALAATHAEPAGSDEDLIAELARMTSGSAVSAMSVMEAAPAADQEVSLEALERAFREAPGPDDAEFLPDAGKAVAAAMGGAGQVPSPAPGPAPETAARDETGSRAETSAPAQAQSIRVNVGTLEHLMTMVSELVLTRNQLLEMVRRLGESEFKAPLQRLSSVTAELQDGIMKTRMQPIGNAWAKLPRIVRDLAQDLGKKIELEMRGADTELDRQVLELIRDPLTHMVRNSADHGLEPAETRKRLGKPGTGTIALSAYHEGGHIIIEIADDGAGLNTERVKAKIVERGLATGAELERMSELQIHRFIFKAGFSTADTVTSISGRGVGMDVVRSNIETIGGTVDVRSEQGRGSTFIIKIPLTLAIVPALIVESGGHRFAIPQLSVVELVRTNRNAEHRIERINDTPVLRLRNKLLPLVTLSKLLELKDGEDAAPDARQEDENLFVVVIQAGAQLFGVVVDSVFDTEEIVVKPMSSMLRDITLFSGNTILGDGSVIMIIDPNGVARAVAQTPVTQSVVAEDEPEHEQTSEDAASVLLFRAATGERKAVPLSLVTRLEEIDTQQIERANGRDMVQYRGALMPLVYVDEEKQRKADGQYSVLVFTDRHRSMGLVADEIVDIVEDRLNVEIRSDIPGMIGTAVIGGKATEVVDIAHYLEQAFDDWTEHSDGAAAGARGARVLLVDDSAFFRNMLAPLLSASGYTVTLADSAHKALDLKARGERFDIIISDIEMPEMDGIALAESLRGDPDWKDTPIIALSSHTAPHVIERSRQAGFADFVGKFDRHGLIESIRECSAHYGAAA